MDNKALRFFFGGGENPFPRAPEHIQPILLEFLEAVRQMKGEPEYLPGPSDKKAWYAGAHKLYNEFNEYKPGFITWAIQKNAKNFPDTKYIKWPWSLRYLWEKYNPETSLSYDELLEEKLDKDRKKFYKKSVFD